MKIWHPDGPIEMKGYSIADHIAFDIFEMASSKELSSFEKLFIVNKDRRYKNPGNESKIYLECGCFTEAKKLFALMNHTRKLGDISWIQGELGEAEQHYSNPKSGAQSYRTTADFDRLLKLIFYRGQWRRYVEAFSKSWFQRGFSEGRVVLGNSETTSKPFLEMLAVALNEENLETPPEVLLTLKEVFGISEKQWRKWRLDRTFTSEKTVASLQRRCLPSPGLNPPLAVSVAERKGETARALLAFKYLRECDSIVCYAQDALERFDKSGSDDDLNAFLGFVTGSGVTSISHTMLFSALGHDSFRPSQPDRAVRLYGSHPVMNKRHFGDLLELKFAHGLPVTGAELLTGLFQQRGLLTAFLDSRSKEFFSVQKLADFSDWAEIRLDDWINSRGAEQLKDIADVWRDGKPKYKRNPFGGLAQRSPRNMVEWDHLLDAAAAWLTTRWKREIGATPWVSENQVYQLVKRQLKKVQVIQHASPSWLAPQHLDVFIPEASFAVEYMGRQHYEPVEFFGGEHGLRVLQQRDQRKQQLCQQHGVELTCIRYDQDIGEAVRLVVQRVKDTLAHRLPA